MSARADNLRKYPSWDGAPYKQRNCAALRLMRFFRILRGGKV